MSRHSRSHAQRLRHAKLAERMGEFRDHLIEKMDELIESGGYDDMQAIRDSLADAIDTEIEAQQDGVRR